MSNTIKVRRTYKKDGSLADPFTVKLSDSTSTFGVKRNSDDYIEVADGTAMTRISLGVYELSFDESLTDQTYTVAEEVVTASGDEPDYFSEVISGVTTTSAASNVWTPNTLATDLMSELNQSRNASGGATPDTLLRAVTEAYDELWEMYEWQYRRVLAELETVSDTATVDLPDDFEKLDQKWLQENNDRGPLWFSADLQRFEARRHLFKDQTGTPHVALIKAKTSGSSYLAEVFLVPTPNAVLTYPYFYLRFAPTLGADDTPRWPRAFNRGWKYLATARATKKFKGGKEWQQDEALWQEWLENAKEENNEVLSSNTPTIPDGYGDLAAAMSNIYAWGSGGIAVQG